MIQGILHLLLLSMSAHITKQLGMAPGGEFRTAFHEVSFLVPYAIYLSVISLASSLSLQIEKKCGNVISFSIPNKACTQGGSK